MVNQYTGVRIVQKEQNRTKPVKAAIVIFDNQVEIIPSPTLTNENIAVATLKTDTWTIVVASVYFEDHVPIEPYLEQIKIIRDKFTSTRLLMGGDFNAWSEWWGSESEDCRGEALVGTLDEMGMHILNEGTMPTFYTIRGGKEYKSHVDVTACCAELLPMVHHWRVDMKLTSSDHNAIVFTIKLEKPTKNRYIGTTRTYNTKKANWSEFRQQLEISLREREITGNKLEEINNIEKLESTVANYISCIEKACNNTIPKINRNPKYNLPWWSEELEALKREMLTKKRRIPCAAKRRRRSVIEEYLKIKEKYGEETKKAQMEGWKHFCTKQDRESLWDGVYRVIRKTCKKQEDMLLVRNGQELGPEESAELLATTFFPQDNLDEDNADHLDIRLKAMESCEKITDDSTDPPFTRAELRRVMQSFNPKKAPGPDGFTANICAEAISKSEDIFLGIANKCLELSCFPSPWKKAAVVVLRKPGREDYTQAKSYRPIGLLSVLGKILEKMMTKRINWHILPKANPRQYGFVPQRCTEDSLYDLIHHLRTNIKKKLLNVVISLDIEGAFDSAWWPAVKCQLAKKKCPQNLRQLVNSYLENRTVCVRYAGREVNKQTTKGCVQGSISGPVFWNLILDPLLVELQGSGVYTQAFADDIVLVFSGLSTENIEPQVNSALSLVYEWGIKNKLKFAPHKTNSMIVTTKLKYDAPRLHMGGQKINLVDEIKILGVIIDSKLTFNRHVQQICKKSIDIFKQLARAAKISWGLHPEIIRTMYMAVIEPIILYAASSWAPASKKITVQKRLNAVQRGFAQKICRSYRTVSLNAALIISGLLPLDLRIQEAASIYEAKRGKPQDFLGGRQVEKKTSYLRAPHPSAAVEIDFKCLENANPDTLADHNVSGLLIFTDGSKIEGKVGAALSCWRENMEIRTKKYKLEPFCTVFQAEMYALYQATEIILEGPEDSANVFSDSRSSLELLKNPDTFHPLAFQIRQNISKIKANGKNIQLFWIRAHVGVEGNERADHLAKLAALRSKTASNYDKCPISYIKRQIRNETISVWNRRYVESETAGVTKLFLPDAIAAYRLVRKIEWNPTLVQVMTGHGGFSHYLNRFKCKASPACICDPDSNETVQHILFDCPKYDRHRFELENKINSKLSVTTIGDVFNNKENRPYLLEYCIKLSQDVINRNKNR